MYVAGSWAGWAAVPLEREEQVRSINYLISAKSNSLTSTTSKLANFGRGGDSIRDKGT